MIAPDPIIPRSIVWADPQLSMVKISPNGKTLSYLAPFQGNLNLWLAPVDDWETAKSVSSSQHPLRDYWWAKTNDHLLYIHDTFGDENWQLHAFQLSTGKSMAYTKPGSQVRIIHISEKQPEKILIGLNDRDRRFHDVYLLDLLSGSMECIYINNQYWDFLADEDLNLKIGLKVDAKGGEYIDISNQSDLRSIIRIAMHDVSGLYFYPRLRLNISSDKQSLALACSVDSNTSTLISVNI